MLDVISVGNSNIDFIVNSRSVNEASDFIILPGGSALNFAVGCSRLGLKAGFLGFTGTDEFSKIIIDCVKREGVKSLIKKVKGNTGFVVVFTKERFKKFIKYSGVNSLLESINLRPYLGMARHIHLATPPLSLLKQLKGDSTSVDPGSQLSSYSLNELRPYLRNVTVFFPNEDEAFKITGKPFRQAAKDFIEAGVKIVIIKLGRGGCFLMTEGAELMVKSIDYPVTDTTGAGDAFASAFISAWLSGKPLSDACKWGILSSNVCVTRLGAQNSATLKELNELYNKYYTK